MHSGGIVSGNGTIGGVVLNSGGTLSPGNSIGTMSVTGNAAFNSGSTYLVEINDGGNALGVNNDLVVAGTATIQGGAIFRVVPENGTDDGTTYAPNTQYTIVQTAAPGSLTVNGTPTITDTFAFLNFTGSHDGQNFYLTSSAVAASFCLPGASFNQCQTGEAMRDLGAGNPAFDAVINMNADDARRAFDLSSGEIHASGQHVINQTFALFNRTLRYQGVAGIGAGNVGAEAFTAPLGYGPAVARGNEGVVAIDGATDYADARVRGAWAAPLGGFGRIDGDGNAGELKWWNGGLAGGYEGVIDLGAGNAVGGLGFGYIRSHASVDARLSSFDSDGFYLGAYGAWVDGPWTVAGSLSYGANRVSTERNIAFMGTTAEASYWTHSIGLSGEASHAFDLADTTRIAPLFTLDAGWSGHGGFNETGAGALNLSSGSESWTRFDAGIGLAVTHAIMTESGRITLEGRAVWEHAFADVVPSQALTLAGSPTGFTVHGPAADRNRLRLGAGLSWDVSEDMTVRARYDGLFSGDQNNHTASFGLNIRF